MSLPPSSGRGSMEVSRLIAEVHHRPELWDRQHPQHHNRSVLDHHWDSVADLLGITGKAARGKWKNLKDHFRKEYKRCVAGGGGGNGDQDASRWPYFYPMMFIREQISHTVADASAAFPSDFQCRPTAAARTLTASAGDVAGGGPWYPAGPDDCDEDCGDGYRPLNCLHVEYGNRPDAPDENLSDDEHFLLSLLPVFSTLAPDKKLRARIAIETSLLNIAYPDHLTAQGRKSAAPGTEIATPDDGDHAPDTTVAAPEDAGSAASAAAPAAVVTATATCAPVAVAGNKKKRKSENDRSPARKRASCAADAR